MQMTKPAKANAVRRFGHVLSRNGSKILNEKLQLDVDGHRIKEEHIEERERNASNQTKWRKMAKTIEMTHEINPANSV